MRARNLKPGFFKNEILGAADPLYGLLFQGLWLMADREGRLADIPRRIMAELFPYRKRVRESLVDKILDWLHRQGFIERYELDGRRYIQIVQFLQHQNPHKNESPSKIPSLTPVSHQSQSGNDPTSEPESTPEHSGAEEQPRHDVRPASSLNPHSLIPESLLHESSHDRPRPLSGEWKDLRAAPREQLASDFDNLQRVQAAYPAFGGNQSDWELAERCCLQRLDEGATWDDLEAAAQRFAAYVVAGGRSSPQYVDLPSKFFGNGLWKQLWAPPLTKSETLTHNNLDAMAQARRELFGGANGSK